MNVDRLTDEQVAYLLSRTQTPWNATEEMLAREVQAHRKLVADLLALHAPIEPPTPPFTMTWCKAPGCEAPWPCPTVRLIEADRG